MKRSVDFTVAGAGIVGLAIAREILTRQPDASLVVLEKEREVAIHQTGRNSGVIHSGVYYAPGSAKARLAKAGCASIKSYCEENGIPYRTSGKVIVAVDPSEIEGLERVKERGSANGIEVTLLDADEVRELEPAVRCLRALYVPSAGVVDFGDVARSIRDDIERKGAEVLLGHLVESVDPRSDDVVVWTQRAEIRTRRFVNATGLYSDRVAKAGGVPVRARIIPFRGEYFSLDPPSASLVRGLIYPVPDIRYPFLGVHLTRSIHDEVHAGPNAVLALSREGYGWMDVSVRDTLDAARFPGLWKFAFRHAGMALGELHRSLSTKRFYESARRLVPGVRMEDLKRSPAGVRAQALGVSGDLIDDFMIERSGSAFHVLNAPSPAATSSLEIAKEIADTIGL